MSMSVFAMTVSRSPCFCMSLSPFFGPIPGTPALKSVPIIMHTSTSCSLVMPRSSSIFPESTISVLTSL